MQFRAFTSSHNGLAALLVTEISIQQAYDPRRPPAVIPPSLSVQALWDTGASCACISPAAVAKLGLLPTGNGNLQGAVGPRTQRPTYMVNAALPNGVTMVGFEAIEFDGNGRFDFILGMNIITHGDFSITNVGRKTLLSFRTPSCESIDYVVAANRLRFAGVGRNAPCPCGSGQKYKRCHGKLAGE